MRGQASIEYLITYGWAFLVIIVAIGGLAYFGMLSPSRWVPDKCDTGSQLVCVDYLADSQIGMIKLYVRNDFGKSIVIDDLKLKTDEGEIGTIENPVTIEPGKTEEIVLSDSLNTAVRDFLATRKGEKIQMTLRIEFERQGSGNQHWLTGVLYTKIQ